MPKAPDQRWRRERLRALAEHVDFAGKAGLGRALGYKDGAFVGQMLNGMRPITEKTVAAVHALRGGKFRGWFDRSGGVDQLATGRLAEPTAEYRVLQDEFQGLISQARVQQMLRDLDDLTPGRQSALIDMIHQEAEHARAQAEHLANKRQTTAAARKTTGGKASTLKLKIGDGNPNQGRLDFHLVEDPFSAEPAPRELELYHRIEKSRTHRT